MFITKKHLSRRTFLRGAGVTLALPLLDSMFPALVPSARAQARIYDESWGTQGPVVDRFESPALA